MTNCKRQEKIITDLKAEIVKQRSTIEAWNHAEIMTCGCKYNRVWAGTKWQHWFVPCKTHDLRQFRGVLQQILALLDESAGDIEAAKETVQAFLQVAE